jgi:peroxiredoxin (alkyl hydroperoxide reductase subunit C)
MKSVKITLLLALLSASTFSQVDQRIPLIGEKAPAFKAESTIGPINFPADFGNHWKLILSHPADFTPVCSSELIELAHMQEEFKALNVDLIVISTDPLSQHQLWVKGIEEIMQKDQASFQKIAFPLVDDQRVEISRKYGMLHSPTSSVNKQKDVRGVFIIDPSNTIRFTQFLPMEIGRNLNELKRTVMALQTSDHNQVLTPVNWEPGDDVLIYGSKNDGFSDPDVYQLAWFLTYKKL